MISLGHINNISSPGSGPVTLQLLQTGLVDLHRPDERHHTDLQYYVLFTLICISSLFKKPLLPLDYYRVLDYSFTNMTADDTKAAEAPAETTSLAGTKAVNGASEKSAPSHPLGPLTADEISRSSALIRGQWPENTQFIFKILTLLEPPKAELVPYLEAEKAGETPKTIERKSQVVYYLRNTVSFLFSHACFGTRR